MLAIWLIGRTVDPAAQVAFSQALAQGMSRQQMPTMISRAWSRANYETYLLPVKESRLRHWRRLSGQQGCGRTAS
jgi:hypothetical protein